MELGILIPTSNMSPNSRPAYIKLLFIILKLKFLKQTLYYIHFFWVDYYIHILKLSIKQFVFSICFLCMSFWFSFPLRIETDIRISELYEFGFGEEKIRPRSAPLSCLRRRRFLVHYQMYLPIRYTFWFAISRPNANTTVNSSNTKSKCMVLLDPNGGEWMFSWTMVLCLCL
jgi:hypothetical protein